DGDAYPVRAVDVPLGDVAHATSAQLGGTAGTVSAFELFAKSALAFDAPACVVVPHPLRVAHFLYVVDGDLESFTQPPGASVSPGPPAGPLPVGGHQDDRDIGNSGPRFDEGLDTGVLGDPLLQVAQVGRGAGAARHPCSTGTPKPIEQSHL